MDAVIVDKTVAANKKDGNLEQIISMTEAENADSKSNSVALCFCIETKNLLYHEMDFFTQKLPLIGKAIQTSIKALLRGQTPLSSQREKRARVFVQTSTRVRAARAISIGCVRAPSQSDSTIRTATPGPPSPPSRSAVALARRASTLANLI